MLGNKPRYRYEIQLIPEGGQRTKVIVKVYPGVFSQVVEGVDGMLRMPNGCFEQTSSSAYPNILIVQYMREHK